MTTVKDLIAALSRLDPELEVVIAYDGRFMHSFDPAPALGHGSDLYLWQGKPDDAIAIIDAE